MNPSSPDILPATDLALMLRSHTKTLHTAAERAGLMPDLLRGHIERSQYCRLLRNFHEIYSALESALARHASQPSLQALQISGLSRRNALAADLAVLHGEKWQAEIPLAHAGRDYAQRLRELEANQPQLLLAHSYVRYLGDLSGGQMLRQIVARALQLDGGAGLAFYTFTDPDATELAARYRRALQHLSIDSHTAAKIVEEAQSAFQRHIALFEELAMPTAGALI